MSFKSRKAFSKAQTALEEFRYSDAETSLTEILANDRDNFESLLHRALVRIRLSNASAALDDANRCAEIRPESALSHMIRGECLLELKKYAEAREAFLQSIKLEKDNGRVFYGLGVACRALGLRLDAADAFEQALHFERDFVMANFFAERSFQ